MCRFELGLLWYQIYFYIIIVDKSIHDNDIIAIRLENYNNNIITFSFFPFGDWIAVKVGASVKTNISIWTQKVFISSHKIKSQ